MTTSPLAGSLLLEGKVVVVSGVGPGLGRSIAVRCALAGADIVLAARTEARLREVAADIAEHGGKAVAVTTDITDEESTVRLAETALEEFGRVDTLVNNAFAMPPMADLADADFEKIRASMETNVFAALRLTNLFTPALIASHGSVVMINSAVLRHSRRRQTVLTALTTWILYPS